jgi:galactonate dehydratase
MHSPPANTSLNIAGGLATVGVVADIIQPAIAAARAVEDKFTSIKIRSIATFPQVGHNLVKIETNLGIAGWGDIAGVPPKVGDLLCQELFDLLDGENPTRVDYLWDKLFNASRELRGDRILLCVLGGIDMALWDITGKLHGVPVYRLFGGPTRDRVRTYNTPIARKTPPRKQFPWSGDEADIRHLLDTVADVRKQVGPDGSVMVDCHCKLPPPIMIQFANAIEPYNVLWVEEVACPGNIEVFKRIKQQCRVPVALGERDRSIWECIAYLQNGCIDIFQCDCGQGGGITPMRKIAALCEAYHVPIAPHSTLSNLGISGSLTTVGSVPNFLIQELYPNDLKGVLHATFEQDKNYDYSLPQGPGLGCEVDEDLARKNAKLFGYKYHWPNQSYSDGSVIDY